MTQDYDMSIHTNPDARAWAKLFYEINPDLTQVDMVAWFGNAMMAMHDHLVLKGAPINGDHAAFLVARENK